MPVYDILTLRSGDGILRGCYPTLSPHSWFISAGIRIDRLASINTRMPAETEHTASNSPTYPSDYPSLSCIYYIIEK